VEAESLAGLPPSYIETAEFDCLHDDGILYARLLQREGIEVVLNETKGTMHGFDIAIKASTTMAVMEQRIAFMKRLVAYSEQCDRRHRQMQRTMMIYSGGD
jgi:acetyl esterase